MSRENIFKKVISACTAVAILSVLVGCRTSVPVSQAPTLPTQVSSSSEAKKGEIREDGLTLEEAATLKSLKKVDAYPLYTMHYQGSYDGHGSTFGEGWLKAVGPIGPYEAWSPPWGCSLFAALGDPEDMHYGRNFDWRYSPALLLFTDPVDGYAAVSMVDIDYLGFGGEKSDGLLDLTLRERKALLETPYLPFDGMNEAGLVVGMAAVPSGFMTPDPTKETVDSLLVMRMILDQAATVDEAVAILEGCNLDWGGGPPLHYLIADSTGRSVLVEFYQGEMVILPNLGPWQVVTNFLRSSMGFGPSGQCWRYDQISDRLEEMEGTLTAREAMELLSDVSQESSQWSVVYEMNRGEVKVVMGRKYDQVHMFSLQSMGD